MIYGPEPDGDTICCRGKGLIQKWTRFANTTQSHVDVTEGRVLQYSAGKGETSFILAVEVIVQGLYWYFSCLASFWLEFSAFGWYNIV